MKCMTRVDGLAAAVVLAWLGMFAATASAVDLLATQDARIESIGLDPSGTPKNDQYIIIKLDVAPNERKVYMEWDLSSITLPVASADLEVISAQDNATVLNSEFDVYACPDGDICETWDEATLTWENAPRSNLTPGAPDQFAYPRDPFLGLTKVGSFSIVNPVVLGDTWTMSSTPELVAAINADTNDTLTLMMAAGETDFPNGYGPLMASKDHADLAGPILKVTLIPEPATWCLLGLGWVALLASYRRRSR